MFSRITDSLTLTKLVEEVTNSVWMVNWLFVSLVVVTVTAIAAAPVTSATDILQDVKGEPNKNLTYSPDSLNEHWDCYYCTDQYFSNSDYFQRECRNKNVGKERFLLQNGLVYKPWCRKASGIGFVRNCTLPSLTNGQLHCPNSNRVYRICHVECAPGYVEVQNKVQCMENGSFDGPVQCQPLDCGYLPAVSDGERISCDEKYPKRVGNSCNISCPGNASPRVVRCLSSGDWSNESECAKPAHSDGGGLSTAGVIVIVSVLSVVVAFSVGVAVWYFCNKKKQRKMPESVSTSVSTSTSSLERKTSPEEEVCKPLLLGGNNERQEAFSELISEQREQAELNHGGVALPLQGGMPQQMAPPTQGGLTPHMAPHKQGSLPPKMAPPPIPSDPPPSYRTVENSTLNLTSGADYHDDLGAGMSASAADPDETELKQPVFSPPSAGVRSNQGLGARVGEEFACGPSETVDYADADTCSTLLAVLHETQNQVTYNKLKYLLDVNSKEVKATSIDGAAEEILGYSKEYTDWIVDRCQGLRNTPYTLFIELMIQADKKLGHLVMYFSKMRSKRVDVLREITKIHPECSFCTQYYKKHHLV
ncbi:uncharacterized protein LOC121376119 [Gigantopelta aegis]|uniref:uncharacterized protein LOC121376119 n=1 Tax=Gigantopelta aegis TaxID=1735272 RepID=UPI001B88DA0A|nr:uncharacterized protein LOC121376119 [Gigantopelta aegis]